MEASVDPSASRATARTPGDEERQRRQLRSYEPVETEYSDVPLAVLEGAVPDALRGVLYRNGPGRLERGGVEYGHLFDGDGMVTRFAFGDGGVVRYRNRFVRTREFREEEAAGTILHRNFGTNRPGGFLANAFRLKFKNAANTSVLAHTGELFALWEGGLPHRLDPRTLETLGRYDFDGALRTRGSVLDRAIAPALPFSAHPRRDPATGEVFNFGAAVGSRPSLMLYRLDARGRMDPPRRLPLDAAFFAHDFALTANWCVFLLSPVAFRMARTLLGLDTPVASIVAQPGAARWLLVPRRGGAPVTVATPSCFVFHHANAFEDARGRVVIDAVRFARYPELPGLRAMRRGDFGERVAPRLTRFTVDPVAGTADERGLGEHAVELPTVDPRRVGREHRFVWAAGNAPELAERRFLNGVVRFEPARGAALGRDFGDELVGEPLFVPDPRAAAGDDGDEEAGWLLVLSYVPDLHRSELRVLDARDLRTVCRLALPHHVPPGFHGTFVSG